MVLIFIMVMLLLIPTFVSTYNSRFDDQPSKKIPVKVVVASIVGMIIGCFLGYILRPSVPLLGQLPLNMILSGGSNLSGVDYLLKSTLETSLTYMWVGTILGLIGGAVVGFLMFKGTSVLNPNLPSVLAENKSQFSVTQPEQTFSKIENTPREVVLNQSPEEVQSILGKPEKVINLGAKVLYVYRDLKVVFIDGKVSDVQ